MCVQPVSDRQENSYVILKWFWWYSGTMVEDGDPFPIRENIFQSFRSCFISWTLRHFLWALQWFVNIRSNHAFIEILHCFVSLQIPEFDNLYLDMNGIIHQCSHPNDEDVHFRISEEKIFADIFHYVEVLFRIIKPCKVFFMAVDGVAPRAKMNQQRGRRFR